MNDDYYMNLCLKLARKAYNNGDIPVGAIIVKDNKILSTGFNKKNSSGKTIDHAEIIAITKANRKLGDWRLSGCTMYVSLEPCNMCKGAIEEARIDRVVYSATNKFGQNRKTNYNAIDNNLIIYESINLLKNFFDERR